MTDAELIEWACQQCSLQATRLGEDGSPIFVDALALQLWRRWSIKEIFTSDGTVSELRWGLERYDRADFAG